MIGAVFATLGLVAARRIAPGRHELELDVYVLVLGGMAWLVMVALLRQVAPRERGSRLAAALEPPDVELPRIPELDRLERELYMSASKEFDLHYRLRPVVREIAARTARAPRAQPRFGKPGRPRARRRPVAAREPGPRAATQPAGAGARAGRAPPNSREPGASLTVPMTIEELNEQAERILAEVERAVVGKREALELVLLGILSDGHVLIEDFPGLAKTLIARSFAAGDGDDASRASSSPPT